MENDLREHAFANGSGDARLVRSRIEVLQVFSLVLVAMEIGTKLPAEFVRVIDLG